MQDGLHRLLGMPSRSCGQGFIGSQPQGPVPYRCLQFDAAPGFQEGLRILCEFSSPEEQ